MKEMFLAFVSYMKERLKKITHSCGLSTLNLQFQNYAILFNAIDMYFRDYLDFPSYPQSFDIAVSPDLRNSKSQGKGDRNRREK